MRRCQGCGGVLGRDCWNEQDCVWIGQQQDNEAYQKASLVPELENENYNLEAQLHVASNHIEYLSNENNRLTNALKKIETMSENRSSTYGLHILNITRQVLRKEAKP